jgi:DNA-binding NarL/FixJ family response regulator
MLTGHTGNQALIGAIMAGAAGYIRKDNYAETLVSAVRAVAAGESVLDAHAAAIALDLVRERLAHRPGQELSTQEKRILELIGQGLTDQMIARRLGVPPQAASAQARTLLGKLGLLATQAAGVSGGLAG